MKDKISLKWLIKNSAEQKWNLLILILLNVFFSALSVLFALAVKAVIDGAVSGAYNYLIGGAITLGAVIILQFVFRVLINGLTEHIKGRLDVTFRTKVFKEILGKSYSKITDYHSGELMNRLTNDVNVVTDGLVSIVPNLAAALARLIMAVIALIYLDWVFALAFVVAGGLVFVTTTVMRGKLKSLHKKVQETEGTTRSFMQESIENVLAVKAFSADDKVGEKADQMHEENFKAKMRRKNYSVTGHAVYNFIFSAGYLFALIFGAVKLFTGVPGFTYGTLSAVLQLVNNVQVPFMALSNVMPKYYAMLSSAERIIELEKLEDEVVDRGINVNELYGSLNSINFENACFAYDEEMVLSNVNVKIDKGEFVAITGVSGIGKSTFIKLLLGVYSLTDGKMYFETDNENIELGNSTRKLFSFVPQGNMLLSGSIKDNLVFFTDGCTDAQIENALKISQADGFVSELPNGINTVVGEKGLGLSEGQIQRLAIARALLSDAPIILLDEATSALDEQSEKNILEGLRELKNKTVIIITHKKAALAVCDKQIMFEDGKVEVIKKAN